MLRLPITFKEELKPIVTWCENNTEFSPVITKYNKDKHWSAISLRGYDKDIYQIGKGGVLGTGEVGQKPGTGITIKQTVKQTVAPPKGKKKGKSDLSKIKKEYAKLKKETKNRLLKARKDSQKGKKSSEKKQLMKRYKELLSKMLSTKGKTYEEIKKLISVIRKIKW